MTARRNARQTTGSADGPGAPRHDITVCGIMTARRNAPQQAATRRNAAQALTDREHLDMTDTAVLNL